MTYMGDYGNIVSVCERKNLMEKDNKKKGNKLLWSILFIVIAVLSVWAVTQQNKSFSMKKFAQFIDGAKPSFIIGAFIAIISVGIEYNRSLRERMEALLNNTTEEQKDLMIICTKKVLCINMQRTLYKLKLNYLNLRFLAASDFFLRFTLGFS